MAGRPRKQKEATPKGKVEEVVNEAVGAEEAQEMASAEAEENIPAETGESPKRRTRKAAADKKPDAKKAAKPEKAAKVGRPAKQREIETTVYVQYSGRTFEPEKILEAAKEAWIAKGRRTTSIKNLELYINVTENKAYPVINGEPQEGFDC